MPEKLSHSCYDRLHYANTSMLYTAIFLGCKNVNFQMKNIIFFFFLLLNIDCGYTLEPPHYRLIETVLMSTHNLCFRAKIRKKCIPLYTPVLLYKSGV